MRVRLALFALSLWLIAPQSNAQETLADLLEAPGTDLSRPADRARVSARMGEIENTRRTNARAKAAAAGLPLRTVTPGGRVTEIADFDGPHPLYRTTHNANAAISTGANLLRTSPYTLTGSGITIGVWDGGSVRSTHQEFGGRVTVKDGASSIDHATHVGGTLIASGVVANARGMANSAIVDSYDWNSDASEMTGRAATGPDQIDNIYLSNHSYGYITGWYRTGGTSPAYIWYGDGTTASGYEYDFGRYNTYVRDQDSLAYNAPYYLIFRSAGNERTDTPSDGQTVQLSPSSTTTVSYSTSSHPAGDGLYRGGFETIGFEALAKNVITVGSVTDAVTSGTRDPSKANPSAFTSWGPTDDGRIKPDVVANGDALYSSLSGSNTSYGTYSGTSMSSPNACGSTSLLVQQYGNLFPGQAMRASTLKGLLIHTADDRGNPGPDYKFGWGLVNVKEAADLIIDHHAWPEKQRITENQLTTSITTRTHTFVSQGTSPIRATLSWTDPAGTATSTNDLRSPRLVNNLNLKIIAPDGVTSFLPYVMPFVGTWTQASMDLHATTGINNTDNVEQVNITTPTAGTYQVVVSYSGTLTNNSQNYSLLLTGSSADEPPPPPLSVTGITPASGLTGSTVTIDITGTGLAADTTVKLTKAGQSDIAATSVELIGESLRCQVNLTGAATGVWSVTATNLDLETSTLPDAFTVIGAIWSENFDGTVTELSSSYNTSLGSNSWTLSAAAAHSPPTSYFAPGPAVKSTTYLTSPAISINASATDLQLGFWHSFNLQSARDGGKLMFSIDNGAWFDVAESTSGAVFASNGYNATIKGTGAPSSRSEFLDTKLYANASAWSGNSGGFIQTLVNLTDSAKYAGKSLRIRWIIATDSSTASPGWHVDSVSLIGGGDISNQAPVITSAATIPGSTTETVDDITYHLVSGSSAEMIVAASDDGAGEGALTYTWSASGPAPVFFMPNGDNAAKSTTASFEAAGDYQVNVSVSDPEGLSTSSSLNVRISQTATGIEVSPASVTLAVGSSYAFSADTLDQFGASMTSQPSSFGWSVSGGGTISSSGLFTSTLAGGPYAVTATSGSLSGLASVTVNPLSATVTLADLAQTYDGNPNPVTVTTDPAGLAVSVKYNKSLTVPTNVGSYSVEATITDPNYQGSANGTLVIEKATAIVELAGLAQTYDGSPKPVEVTTTPEGLAVAVTYDGSSTAPTDVGSYSVSATVNDPNYHGSTTATLEIASGNDWVSWTEANFTEDEQTAGLAAETSDPDFDGLPNLAEYALGTDPHAFTPPLIPTLDENGLTLTFTRPPGLPDVKYSAESSDELGNWSPVPLDVIVPGDPETVRARDPLTSGDPSKRFLRLRFETP